ncbi:MAG: YXWGXW repeat-containing protein [Minicystis sp.]
MRSKLVAAMLCVASLQLMGCFVRPRRVVYVESAPAPVVVQNEQAVPDETDVDEEVTATTDVPADQVESPGPAPSTTHVWISGRWAWSGHAWAWRHGHWAHRPAAKAWVPGHWERHSAHWVWRAGHWR